MASKEKESNKPGCEKRFVLKHIFENVINLEENRTMYSEKEDHFNVNWCMSVKRLSDHLAFYIHCDPFAPSDNWSIQTNLELKVVNRKKNFFKKLTVCFGESREHGFNSFLGWEKMENEYLTNGNLRVNAKVTIVETIGLGKEKIRKFDDFQKDVSDIIIVVRSSKFYVSKMV